MGLLFTGDSLSRRRRGVGLQAKMQMDADVKKLTDQLQLHLLKTPY